MFCRHRAILPSIIRRVKDRTAEPVTAGVWKKNPERTRIFRYVDKPFREPKKPHNIEKESPRYDVVDQA